MTEGLTSDEEVCGSLPVGRLVPEFNEVLSRFVGAAKECHPTLVDHTDLVKVLVERLAGLVDRYYRGKTRNVGSNPESAHELQSSRGIETTGGAGESDEVNSKYRAKTKPHTCPKSQ